MAGKREEVRGVTPLDIKKINDNFKNLWQSVFGNINFTDVNQEFKNKISALSNKILTVSNSLKIHTSDSLIHVSDTEKAKWDNKENKGHRHSFNDIDKVVASVLLSNKVSPLNGGVGCLNMGGVIFIYGSIKNENALSSGLNSLGNLPEGFRPLNDVKLNVRTLKGLAKLNIYVNGDIKLELTTDSGYIDSLDALSIVYLDGICFKGE